MYAATKALPIVAILDGLAKYHGKRYCYPSQKKVLELLEKRLQIKISIATLNRWLRAIEDEGFITRLRRIRRDKILGTVFNSTLYTLKKKSYALLARMKLRDWKKVKEMMSEREKQAAVERQRKQEENGQKKSVSLSDFRKRHPGLKIPN
jgi:Fe2+ or Zn2+ uptake regulation protein